MVQKGYGLILLLSSMSGKEGEAFMAGYSATMAGIIGLVKAVGKEYAETGITVNGLAPAMTGSLNSITAPEQVESAASNIAMKRLGTVEVAAAVACWIVSPEASFNTGFVFDCSGGRATY